jgi:hypothetical protein
LKQSAEIAVFAECASVPESVAQLGLVRVDANDDPNVGSCFRYEAATPDGGRLGANTFLYDRELRLDDGSESAEAVAERDRSFRALRAGALEPSTIGVRHMRLPTSGGVRLGWQWAALRDSPDSDALITHVAVRVDRGYFNKVLFSYPVRSDEIGRTAFVAFLIEWHRAVQSA